MIALASSGGGVAAAASQNEVSNSSYLAPATSPTACVPSPNYTYTVSTGATLVPGTTDIGNHCDSCTTTILLPFPVSFYGQTFTTVNAASYGNLQFLSDFEMTGDWCGPHSELNYAIAPYYGDLDTEQGGIYTSVSGSAPGRIFNIEWRGCVYDPITYECNDPVDFEVRLYENSPTDHIEYVYGQVDPWHGIPAIVQIQEGTGAHYIVVSCNDPNSLQDCMQISFDRDTCAPPTPTVTGTPPTATPTRTPTGTVTPTATPDGCHDPTPWRNEPPMFVSRSNMASAVLDGKLYVIGSVHLGMEPPYINTVERFDPSTNGWETVAPIPIAAENMGAAALDDKIYVAGGYTVRDGFTLDLMQIYDSATDSWSDGAPMPGLRQAAGVAALNGKIYIIGGENATYYSTTNLWEYNPVTDTYATKAALPVRGSRFGVAVLGGRIYAVGGIDFENGEFLHYIYDPATDTWSSIAPGLTAHFESSSAFVSNGEIWAVAGTDFWNPYPPDQEVQIYNPTTNGWRFGPSFIEPRYDAVAASINDRGYVVGGIDNNTTSYPYTYFASMESIGYVPCSSGTATPTIVPTITGTPPTATPRPTRTATPTATPTACGFPTNWDNETAMGTSRAYAAGAVVNNQLYVIGGYRGIYGSTGVTESYDPSTGIWTPLAPMPTPMGDERAAAAGTKIYVVGDHSSPDMQIYDTTTNIWSLGAPLPHTRNMPAVVAFNGKIYIMGGNDSGGGSTKTVWEYDPATNTYTTKAPMPVGNSFFGAAVIGNLIYTVGGPLNQGHFAYNPATNTWTSFRRAPANGMHALGVFTLNGELWIEGGSDGGTVFPPDQEVLIYNPTTDTWRYGPAFNTPRRYSMATGVIDGRAYVAGGRADSDDSYLSSVESIAFTSCGPTATGTPATSTPTRTATFTATATPTVCE